MGGDGVSSQLIIKNWKRSRQGEGGFQEDADDDNKYFGALADCTQEALNNRASIIKDGKESYLRYF